MKCQHTLLTVICTFVFNSSEYAYRKCSQGGPRCQIRKLFQELSVKFLEKMRINPIEILKTFLEEIKIHREKHIKTKHEQEKQWKELCEKNFAKSLDHRAFYFKQSEKKYTSTKSFYSEIKERFDKWNLATTPELIKKGGTFGSIYYNSLTMLPPEQFHTVPIPGDAIAALTSEEATKLGPKLPQLHLRLDDAEAFTDAYKLIVDQILSGCTTQSEKDKAKLILDKIMIEFFKFDAKKVNIDKPEPFNENDMKLFMNDGFLQQRLELSNMTFADAWKVIKNQNMQDIQSNEGNENKKAKVNRPPKGTRGGHNKKIDKKDNIARTLGISDRGLIHSNHTGAPMAFLLEDKMPKAERKFLPTASELNAVMYGSVNFYSFFRHFHCLYERIIKARALAGKGLEEELERRPELQAKYSSLPVQTKDQLQSERYDQVYLKGLQSLLQNTIDVAKYEDFCRHCLGSQGYLMFSIDKLINSVYFPPIVDCKDNSGEVNRRRNISQDNGPIFKATREFIPRSTLLCTLQSTSDVL